MDTGPPARAAELPAAEIRRCAADPTFVDAAADLYEQLDAEIAARNPTCVNRGSCCRFGEFGHRLFVTPVELAYFLAKTGGKGPASDRGGRDNCPYQRDGQCTVREGRPAGCRIFFCDPKAQAWQGPLTERNLRRLKGLHERLDLPYAYLDWMQALDGLAER